MRFTAHGKVFEVSTPTGEHLATAFDLAGSKAANPIRLACATFAAAGGTVDGVRMVYEDLLQLPASIAGVLTGWSNGALSAMGITVEGEAGGGDLGPLAPVSPPTT